MDRTNRVRAALERDEPAFGAAVSTFSPTLVESLGGTGLDFVWLDYEHDGPSPHDARLLNDLSRAADAAGVELLARLPGTDPHLVRKVLDAGVRNVLVPRVETAAEVREAARATRFDYDGKPGERGMAQGRVTRWGSDYEDYVAEEDGNVTLGAMIESATAVKNVDDILDVPELGFAFVGPGDLSVSLGHPGEKDHPEVREHVERIEAAVRDSDVALAGIREDPDAVAAAVEEGYRLLRVGRDLGAVRSVFGGRVDAIDERL
ncbi:MAG: HpcH/HpaI aldolase/citrate lyase family protein [Haloferacaceae archaeon]